MSCTMQITNVTVCKSFTIIYILSLIKCPATNEREKRRMKNQYPRANNDDDSSGDGGNETCTIKKINKSHCIFKWMAFYGYFLIPFFRYHPFSHSLTLFVLASHINCKPSILSRSYSLADCKYEIQILIIFHILCVFAWVFSRSFLLYFAKDHYVLRSTTFSTNFAICKLTHARSHMMMMMVRIFLLSLELCGYDLLIQQINIWIENAKMPHKFHNK